MPPLIRLGPALLLALIHAAGAAGAQEPPAAPMSHAALRSAGFEALNRCVAEHQQGACAEADAALQALITSAETPKQRLLQPRCLSALTRVETSLHTFRWQLETSAGLNGMVEAAATDCPAPSTPGRQ